MYISEDVNTRDSYCISKPTCSVKRTMDLIGETLLAGKESV